MALLMVHKNLDGDTFFFFFFFFENESSKVDFYIRDDIELDIEYELTYVIGIQLCEGIHSFTLVFVTAIRGRGVEG